MTIPRIRTSPEKISDFMNGFRVEIHTVVRLQLLAYLRNRSTDEQFEHLDVILGIMGKNTDKIFICEDIFEIPTDSVDGVHEYTKLRSRLIQDCNMDLCFIGYIRITDHNVNLSWPTMFVDRNSDTILPKLYLHMGTLDLPLQVSGWLVSCNGMRHNVQSVRYVSSASETICIDTLTESNREHSEHLHGRIQSITNGFESSRRCLVATMSDCSVSQDKCREYKLLAAYLSSLRNDSSVDRNRDILYEMDSLHMRIQSLSG